MTPELQAQLIGLAIQQTPAIVAGLKDLFRKDHPNEAQPTDAEVISAFNTAFVSSLTVDEAWLAAHPKT